MLQQEITLTFTLLEILTASLFVGAAAGIGLITAIDVAFDKLLKKD